MDVAANEISTVHFRKKMLSELPDKSGVYVFWCKTSKGSTKYIYVGMAGKQTLRERLIQHWKGSHNSQLTQWINLFTRYLRVTTIPLPQEKVAPTEKRLICTLMPETNQRYRCPKEADKSEAALIERIRAQTITT